MDLTAFCERWLAAWTGNRPDELAAFYSEDVFYLDPARPEGLRGRAALRAYLAKLLGANPDWHWTAVEIIPTAKGFTLKWEAEIPVGEEVVRERGLDIVEIHDGLVSRNEVYFDTHRHRAALARQANEAAR